MPLLSWVLLRSVPASARLSLLVVLPPAFVRLVVVTPSEATNPAIVVVVTAPLTPGAAVALGVGGGVLGSVPPFGATGLPPTLPPPDATGLVAGGDVAGGSTGSNCDAEPGAERREHVRVGEAPVLPALDAAGCRHVRRGTDAALGPRRAIRVRRVRVPPDVALPTRREAGLRQPVDLADRGSRIARRRRQRVTRVLERLPTARLRTERAAHADTTAGVPRVDDDGHAARSGARTGRGRGRRRRSGRRRGRRRRAPRGPRTRTADLRVRDRSGCCIHIDIGTRLPPAACGANPVTTATAAMLRRPLRCRTPSRGPRRFVGACAHDEGVPARHRSESLPSDGPRLRVSAGFRPASPSRARCCVARHGTRTPRGNACVCSAAVQVVPGPEVRSGFGSGARRLAAPPDRGKPVRVRR